MLLAYEDKYHGSYYKNRSNYKSIGHSRSEAVDLVSRIVKINGQEKRYYTADKSKEPEKSPQHKLAPDLYNVITDIIEGQKACPYNKKQIYLA